PGHAGAPREGGHASLREVAQERLPARVRPAALARGRGRAEGRDQPPGQALEPVAAGPSRLGAQPQSAPGPPPRRAPPSAPPGPPPPMRRLDPRRKPAARLAGTALIAAIRTLAPAGVALLGALALAAVARLPWRWYLRRVAAVGAFVALFTAPLPLLLDGP